MPNDVVIVPVHNRPEFAYLCLEKLAQADGVQDKEVWLCQDQHVGDSPVLTEQMWPVVQLGRKLFKAFDYRRLRMHDTYGNSKNILESLRIAYETKVERVFLVEDDIMVMPDIFRWHEAILGLPDRGYISCATAVNKSAHFPINGRYTMDETFKDSSAYYVSKNAYSSHASAFSRGTLQIIVNRIANNITYSSLVPGMEQDQLIQQMSLASAWPYVPRAMNVGFYSYHISGTSLSGSLSEKVQALRSIIHSPEQLRAASFGNQTVTSVPSSSPIWDGTVCHEQKYR